MKAFLVAPQSTAALIELNLTPLNYLEGRSHFLAKLKTNFFCFLANAAKEGKQCLLVRLAKSLWADRERA